MFNELMHAIMKKKVYNQPYIMISEIMPATIICVSVTNGGSTSNIPTPPGSDIDGD
jgi:hypothetical protein